MTKRFLPAVSLSGIVVGCLLCSLAGYLLDVWLLAARATTTEGVVTSTRQLRGGTLLPTVSFQSASGETFIHESNNPLQFRYRQGQRVPLLYDPADPNEALLRDELIWNSILPSIIIFLLVALVRWLSRPATKTPAP